MILAPSIAETFIDEEIDDVDDFNDLSTSLLANSDIRTIHPYLDAYEIEDEMLSYIMATYAENDDFRLRSRAYDESEIPAEQNIYVSDADDDIDIGCEGIDIIQGPLEPMRQS